MEYFDSWTQNPTQFNTPKQPVSLNVLYLISMEKGKVRSVKKVLPRNLLLTQISRLTIRLQKYDKAPFSAHLLFWDR